MDSNSYRSPSNFRSPDYSLGVGQFRVSYHTPGPERYCLIDSTFTPFRLQLHSSYDVDVSQSALHDSLNGQRCGTLRHDSESISMVQFRWRCNFVLVDIGPGHVGGVVLGMQIQLLQWTNSRLRGAMVLRAFQSEHISDNQSKR